MNNHVYATQEDNRLFPRLETELRSIVRISEPGQAPTKEIAEVTTISRTGAGFTLSRPCEVGRLVTMVLPMPAELRVYDQDAELYPVLALVQNCYRSIESGEERYHIGAALVGKEIPESFRSDPSQNFRIGGMRPNGLWKVVEVGHAFTARKHQRYWKQLPVTLTLLKSATKTIAKESTLTRNIAAKGASVLSGLSVEVGDRIKFACKEFDFYSFAIVRNRKPEPVLGSTIHLEFIDAIFPTEKVRKQFADEQMCDDQIAVELVG